MRERWEIGREREGRKGEDPAGGLATRMGVGDVTRDVFRRFVRYPYHRKPISPWVSEKSWFFLHFG
jgi:hypothetical protein